MRDVVGFEGLYGVTSCGKIYSYKRKIFLKQRYDKYGYKRVTLSKDGTLYTRFVHQLVAQAYIPNPENKPTVNHKNEVKTDNYVQNLEWMTFQENHDYGTRNERSGVGVKKPVRCIETGEVYESIKAAAAAVNRAPDGISKVLAGRNKTCGGYTWELVEEENEEVNLDN